MALLFHSIHVATLIGSRALSQLHPDSIGIMRLPTSPWSNPMKHLIPYLQDDRKAADYLRQLRWPAGVACPRCGSDAVEPRERCDGSVSKVEMATPMALIYMVLFPSVSAFETPPLFACHCDPGTSSTRLTGDHQ